MIAQGDYSWKARGFRRPGSVNAPRVARPQRGGIGLPRSVAWADWVEQSTWEKGRDHRHSKNAFPAAGGKGQEGCRGRSGPRRPPGTWHQQAGAGGGRHCGGSTDELDGKVRGRLRYRIPGAGVRAIVQAGVELRPGGGGGCPRGPRPGHAGWMAGHGGGRCFVKDIFDPKKGENIEGGRGTCA